MIRNRSVILYLVLIGAIFAHVDHGASLQVTSGGTSIDYKQLVAYNEKIDIFTESGFHLQNNLQRLSLYGIRNGFQNLYLETSIGLKFKLFQQLLAGAFSPVLSIASGIDFDIDPNLRPRQWHYNSLFGDIGMGFQFYNGRLLNEILLKYYPWNIRELSLQLSVYWK